MARFVSSATMSLDGFIAHDDNSVDPLFDWFDAGDIEVASANPSVSFHLTPISADYWRDWTDSIGCLLVGRTLFDVTNGWDGRHPLDAPVVVVTHREPDEWAPEFGRDATRFVTSGILDAADLAADIAGDRVVAVTAGAIAGQLLDAGWLDEVRIDLAPVVLGSGRRYFGDAAPAILDDPTVCIPALRVTHLVHPVRKGR